jgi:hypothetical protein
MAAAKRIVLVTGGKQLIDPGYLPFVNPFLTRHGILKPLAVLASNWPLSSWLKAHTMS